MLVTEFQGGLYKDVEFVSPKGTEFRLPKKVAQHHEFRKFLPKLVEAARDGKSMPDEVPDELSTSLESFLDSLAKVIEDEGNSVWTWYILNTLGPSQLSEKKVNRILANPPWVRMSNIQVRNRKKEIESLAKELKLWVGGKHATGFDIAALFILRCRNLYLDEKTGKAAWITNNAAIRGGNWEGFRRRYGQFLAKMIDYGKLKEQPFGGAKSCALIEDNSTKTATAKTTDKLFHLIEDVKKRISPYWKWEEVRDATYLEPAPEPILKGKSDYVGKFRNGATLFPQCLLLVEKMNTEKSGRVMVETRKSCRAPWRNIESPRETVPRRWIIPCIFSNDLLPFTIRPEITQVIIPLGEDGTLEGDPEKDAYWGKADKVWRENRGRGKRNPNYLLNRINFNSALEKQLPITRNNADLCRVVYNGAGQHLRATRCRRSKVLVEHTCYWWDTNSEREAQYLVSMLNSQCLQDAYRECRKSDRHFETHVWNGVPIPCYEPRNDYHLELAGLCLEAENLAAKILRDLDLSNKQVKLSRQIKDALKESGISDRIDEAARKILPDQAR